MRLLADLSISLRPSHSSAAWARRRSGGRGARDHGQRDEEIVEAARADGRTVLTQDLDFSAIIALSGARSPSLVTPRLSSSRVSRVNEALGQVLPQIEEDLAQGSAVTVEDRDHPNTPAADRVAASVGAASPTRLL